MSSWISWFLNTGLLISTLIFIVLSGFLLIECLAALLPVAKGRKNLHSPRGPVAVLIPAHNEELCLQRTLDDVIPQLTSSDRLVVVADNCTDATAEIARRAGAIVLERHNTVQLGKGFALDYGLQYLASNPPELVVLFDADCRVQPTAIDHLTQSVMATGRPTQATYLMEKPAVPSAKDGVSALSFTVKNLVRPLGLHRLSLPCLLTGTGMAFPWHVIRSVNLANGHLVEDMKLSLDLTIAGYAPVYCPETLIIGNLPQQERAARSQRTRWEHGHLESIRSYVPLLLKAGFEKQRPEAFALAFELSIPPLSLFVMMWLGWSIVTIAWGMISGLWMAAAGSAIAGGMLVTAILLAWARFGQSDLPLKELLAIPFYILWKIPLYFKFLVKPQRAWVRTERDLGASPTVQNVVELIDD